MERKLGAGGGLFKGNFLLLATSNFLFVMAGYLVVPVLPSYLGNLGTVEFDVGLVVGMFNLASVFSCIPFGRFIDRHGRRGVLLFGIMLQMTTPFLYTVCTDTPQFMLVRTLSGLGFAAFLVTSHTMVVDLSPKGRLGQVLGIYTMCSLAARAMGPSVSGLLLPSLGYVNTFYVAGLFGLAATAVALPLKVPPPAHSAGPTGGFAAVLRNRNLTTASLAIAVVMMPQGVVNSFFPLYAEGHGVGPEGVGLYFTVYALFTGGIRPLVGSLSDRVGRVAVAVPFGLLTALGVGSFALAGDLAGFLVTGALLGMGMGAALPVLTALSVDTMNPRLRGQAVAVSSTAIDVGISAGAMGMGPVAMAGGYPAAFVATGALVVGGTAAFLVVRRAWKKEETVYT